MREPHTTRRIIRNAMTIWWSDMRRLTIRIYIYSRRKIKQSIGEFLAKDTNLKYTAL